MQNSNNPQNPATTNLVMTAPESTSDFERKDKTDIVKIQPGNHLGRLYGIVDLGTQHNIKFSKDNHRIALLFEFPHLMQDFYKRKEGEQAELRPTMIKMEETFSMHPKSNFRKLIESAVGRKLNDDEAKSFNVFELLGKWFLCNVMHDPDKNNPQNVYERINFLQPYDARFMVEGVNYNGHNDLMAYHLGTHKFAGPNWQGLWTKFRTQIQGSREGQEWAAKGGTFEEVKYNNNDDGQGSAQQNNTYAGPQGAPQGNPMQGQPMQQAPQGAPQQAPNNAMQQPQSQPAQPMQQAPATTPPAAAPQQAPQKKFVIKQAPFDMASWTKEGWTEAMMIEHGYAEYVEGAL
tara:strand:+ start:17278 stop:18318 length:1041 start_codon:yes stop_codon:yes gene_type:complete